MLALHRRLAFGSLELHGHLGDCLVICGTGVRGRRHVKDRGDQVFHTCRQSVQVNL